MANKKFEKFTFDFEALDACPVCSGRILISNGRVNWHDADFWYMVCSKCSLKFMNPRPTRESYKDFYTKLFWEQKVRNIGFHQEGQMWQSGKYKWDNDKRWNPSTGKKNRMDKHREQRVKTIVPALAQAVRLNKNTRILEVGCGFGVTLNEIAKQYHCAVYAIEPSVEAQKTIRAFGTIDIIGEYAEDLEKVAKKRMKFDAVIFSHALENTVDPLGVLISARKCLKKGGIIYIQTPNLPIFDQMNPYHPYIFSNHSLDFMSRKAGLRYGRISDPLNKMLCAILRKS